MSELLTIKEVADKCKVTYRTVQNWIYKRKITFIKLPGGDLRIKQEHLENWIEYRTVKNQ